MCSTPPTRIRLSTSVTAPFTLKCRVIDPAFTWGQERKPAVPWERTIVYEMHVKGFTKLNQHIPAARSWGTFAGSAHSRVAEYLRTLGVTSAELLPVHAFVDDSYLIEKGLKNYWGYNSIAFFAPESALPPFAVRQRVQGNGEPFPRRRHRVDFRRGLQPHG